MSAARAARRGRAGSSGENFAERKRFGRFSEQDAALLAELREVFEREADAVVAAFYDHLLGYDALRPLLSDPPTVERLKKAQRAYLLSLVSGRYDDAYAQGRLDIGRVHERIGLEPQWYLGTYGLYVDLLLPHVVRHYGADTERATRAVTALNKLLVLDMQLVLDAYHETRQTKAVRRSKRLAAVGELAASIAHEVRNPLAGMKGALEILRRGLIQPANREVVDEVMAQIERLEKLVRDLLDFGSPRPLDRQEADLHELLDQVLRRLRNDFDAAGVMLERTYGTGTGRLYADPRQLEQVFINLISNALQAMDGGGTLTVSTRAVDGRLRIDVRDTGQGIAPGVLPQVFQPFFTTRHRGSGLGLSIVRKIVEEHGGKIEVSSEAGRGTTATVTLPLVGA